MVRKLTSNRLVIATHNAGKLKEIQALLAPYGIECLSAGSLGLPEPAETGTTFVENALIKAHAAAKASQIPSLADDSGLSVAALGGRPGVYTADWAERQWFEGAAGRDWYMAMGKVEGVLCEQGEKRCTRAVWMAPSAGRRAVRWVSGTIQYSYPKAMPLVSLSSNPRPSI